MPRKRYTCSDSHKTQNWLGRLFKSYYNNLIRITLDFLITLQDYFTNVEPSHASSHFLRETMRPSTEKMWLSDTPFYAEV